MPAGSLRDPNQLALLLQLAMQEQAPNPANGQPRVLGRPQPSMALNAYADALPSAGEKDQEYQASRTAQNLADSEASLASTKARLADPLEAAKAEASARGFETRRNVSTSAPQTTAPSPTVVKGIRAVTPDMRGEAVGRVPMQTPAPTQPRTVRGVRKLTDAGAGFTDPDAAMGVKERALLSPSVLAAGVKGEAADSSLTKVEHKGPDGKTIIEYLPKGTLRGQTFEKGTNATTENRLASAEAVNQTGQDIISKLSDPQYAEKVGPVLGRYNSLRDFIGDPPPEFAELAGNIESYALASMGVHGMRSAQGAQKIAELMDKKHTPESMIATIKGLNNFSSHFMQNEGRSVPGATPSASGDAYDEYLRRGNASTK